MEAVYSNQGANMSRPECLSFGSGSAQSAVPATVVYFGDVGPWNWASNASQKGVNGSQNGGLRIIRTDLEIDRDTFVTR